MQAPHHSVFTGRIPFLPPNQQRQNTEGTKKIDYNYTDNQACNTHAEQHPKDAIIQSNNILQTFLAKIYKQVILFQFSLQQMKAVT